MELSQSALAMLLLYGILIGVLFALAYRITDISTDRRTACRLILINVKDFLFMILGAIVAVLEVYYLNDGDFRYLAVAGMLAGFWLFDKLAGKAIVRVRNAIFCHLMRIVLIPVTYLWSITIGPLRARKNTEYVKKKTLIRVKQLTNAAENGFENYTEAKE